MGVLGGGGGLITVGFLFYFKGRTVSCRWVLEGYAGGLPAWPMARAQHHPTQTTRYRWINFQEKEYSRECEALKFNLIRDLIPPIGLRQGLRLNHFVIPHVTTYGDSCRLLNLKVINPPKILAILGGLISYSCLVHLPPPASRSHQNKK